MTNTATGYILTLFGFIILVSVSVLHYFAAIGGAYISFRLYEDTAAPRYAIDWFSSGIYNIIQLSTYFVFAIGAILILVGIMCLFKDNPANPSKFLMDLADKYEREETEEKYKDDV